MPPELPSLEAVDLHVGKRIRRRRRLLGLSQDEVAQACGVGFRQVQKYETGMSRISAAMLMKVASALGAPISYFFEGLSTTSEFVSRTRDGES